MRPLLSIVPVLLLAACAPAGGGAPGGAGAFAPALGVELAAMTRTPSGLLYRDVSAGEGEPVSPGDRVAVHYVGWLPDGTQVDARVPPQEPLEFRVGAGQVIRGWEEGVVGMRPGGQRQLVVPPHLGYGRADTGAVPPNTTLVFLLELR